MGEKEEQARAKKAWANDLEDQGEFEEALALHQEALELFTEVRFQYATSMCACACIAVQVACSCIDVQVAFFFAFVALFATRCLRFVFYRWSAKTPPGRGHII